MSLNIQNQAIGWDLIIVLDFYDVADMKLLPGTAQKPLLTPVEHKLLTLEIVNRICGLLKLLVL